MTVGQRADAVVLAVDMIVGLVGLAAVIVLATVLAGCTPPSEGPDVQSVPIISADSGAVSGSVEVETPAGLLVFDLSGKVLAGDATGYTLRRVDVDIEGLGTVNGQPASVAVETRNSYSGEWTHCLSAELGAMGYLAHLRYPLSPSCGPAGLIRLEMRPFPGTAATVDE